MAIVTNRYSPSQGATVISSAGARRFTESLDYFSNIFSSIYSSVLNNKFAVDSCWESGNIYYANYDEGSVKKIGFDGTELASLALTHPLALSIVQYSDSMRVTIPNPPQTERGCWIIDEYTIGAATWYRLVLTDSNLNVLKTIDSLIHPVCVIPSLDGGCFVADQDLQSVLKYAQDGTMVAIFVFVNTYPKELALDLSNADGNLWVLCENDSIYNFSTTGNNFVQNFFISPAVVGSHVGAMDIDKNTTEEEQYLYVTGGSNTTGWVKKYDKDGNLVTSKTGLSMAFPYIIKVAQGYGANCGYVLTDSSKWDEYKYDSSSSSSDSSSSSSSP